MAKKINLIVFSLTTPIPLLLDAIEATQQNDLTTFCISPHKLFDTEITCVKNQTTKEISFVSFYEFISQKEMEYCDTEADNIIISEKKNRYNQLGNYYSKIKELKNAIILKNIKSKYQLESKYILSDDLGIDVRIWLRNGFNSCFLPESPKITISDKVAKPVKFIVWSVQSLAWLVRFLLQRLNNKTVISFFETSAGTFILFGRQNRITQYLDSKKYTLSPLPRWEVSYLNNLLILCSRSNNSPIAVDRLLSSFLLDILTLVFKTIKGEDIHTIISSMHENNDMYGFLASKLGVKMVYLQDGFLPSYYPSAYLRYRLWANKYYIRDKLSKGIFERHSLNYELWDCYAKTTLPIIEAKKTKIQNVLFLTSGAGDWTALKNRSDEDLAFLAFIEAAKKRPDVKFIYRPHPLWMHPEHQGVKSIKRVIEYSEELKLPNFVVSAGALKEGITFMKDKHLSVEPTTINHDINSADIVFGDHSQSLLTAAQRKKIIASVSLANRKEFFFDYTKLGFPILRSSEDMVSFIKEVETGSNFIEKYNESIKLYNDEHTR